MNRHKSSRQNQAIRRHQDFLRSFFPSKEVKPSSLVMINGWKLTFSINPNDKSQWHIKEERLEEVQ